MQTCLLELRRQLSQRHVRFRPLGLHRGELRLQHVHAIPQRIGPSAFGFPTLFGPIGSATFRGKIGSKGFDGGCVGLDALAGGRNGSFQRADEASDLTLCRRMSLCRDRASMGTSARIWPRLSLCRRQPCCASSSATMALYSMP
jgi:hypothetical protein